MSLNIMSVKRLLPILLFPLLTGCEFLYELLEIPDPQKVEVSRNAEGRAIGSACRHTGRSLEDCYVINPGASKAAIFEGWREMNDYMLLNQMEVVPSQIPQPGEIPLRPRPSNPLPPPTGNEVIEPPEFIVPGTSS